MKKLTSIAAITVIMALFAGPGLADEKSEYMEKKERYEMMQPEGMHMQSRGDDKMAPCVQGKSADDCWMGRHSDWHSGWHGGYHGDHHGHWLYGGYVFAKLLVVGFLFWLLFSIHKSLKVIADSKKKE